MQTTIDNSGDGHGMILKLRKVVVDLGYRVQQRYWCVRGFSALVYDGCQGMGDIL